MEWKALLIIIKEVDAMLDSTTYKGTLTSTEITDAGTAITKFPTVINSITSGNATMVFPDKTIVLNKLTKIAYVDSTNPGAGVWPDSGNVYDALKLQGEKWDWGQYDSVFVVHPLPGGGWGIFDPTNNRGATYGTVNAKAGWLTICNGEVFLHEWLHGACGFFRQMGYAMPEKLDTSVTPNVTRIDADCAGVLGYTQDASSCWKSYYIDLMTNKAVDKTNSNKPMGGVPLEAWKSGNLLKPQFYVGFSKHETAYDKNAFKEKYKSYAGVPKSDVHKWEAGFIQDFASKNGDYAIMQGEGKDYVSAYVVKPDVWKIFLEHGGAGALGYPTNDAHSWGNGTIQDFKTKDGWQAGIMKQNGSNDFWVVKGNCWKAYIHFGGATGDLGYPVGNEFLWYSDKYKMDLHIQKFQNKRWVWVMSKSPWTMGTNKEYREGDTESIEPSPME